MIGQTTDVYLFIQDTLADWEIGYVTAEINSKRFFKKDAPVINLHTVADTLDPVRTMGGLTVVPDCTVDCICPGNNVMIILPGSNSWSDLHDSPIIGKVKSVLDSGGTVCAICGATVVLADFGILDNRRHTSNGPGFLEYFSKNYKGQKMYEDVPAVSDGGVITAGASSPVQWSKLILEKLSVFSENTLEAWYNYYETGNPKYFYDIQNSLNE